MGLCDCKEWKEFHGLIDSGLMMMHSHGMKADATNGITFNYCPWCGKKLVNKNKCDICNLEGDWINVIRSHDIYKKDGSDFIVCNECLNMFANQEWNNLNARMRKGKKE